MCVYACICVCMLSVRGPECPQLLSAESLLHDVGEDWDKVMS